MSDKMQEFKKALGLYRVAVQASDPTDSYDRVVALYTEARKDAEYYRVACVNQDEENAELRAKLEIEPVMTQEHDAEIAYYEAHVRGTRRDTLNAAEWPELDREIVRIGEVRQLIQSRIAGGTGE